MPKRKQNPGEWPTTGILPDKLVPAVTGMLADSLGPRIVELSRDLGLKVEDSVRFSAVSRQCAAARERARVTITEAAKRLRVPQYRIRDIECGCIQRIGPDLFREYVSLLGLSRWYSKWRRENVELAGRLEGKSEKPARRARRPRSPSD